MRQLLSKKFLINFKKYLPIILIAAFAVLLRLYLFEKRVSFDADQEEIAFKAKEILTGNPVLLGPKTSLGGFSIGPGFTYLWAVFALFLKGDPLSGAFLSVFLGILFIIGIYLVAKKIFSEKVGLILAFMVTLSVNFIQWDQLPWAPSLFYLSELIVFYGVYISGKNKWGIPLVALGLGMGLQSHFAVFLLFIPILVYLLLYRPVVEKKQFLISLITIIASVMPLVIYDFMHGFINFQRLLSIFRLGIEGEEVSKLKIMAALGGNCVNIIWTHFPWFLVYGIFALILLYSFWGIIKDKKYRPALILSDLFLLIPFITFLFYKSNFSEYYLMSAVVPFLVILGYIFSNLRNKFTLFVVLGIFSFLNFVSFIYIYRPMNLYAKRTIVQEIVKKGGTSGYGVSLSVQLGYGFGYRYLFDYYQAKPDIPPVKNQTKIFTIVSPLGYEGIEPMVSTDGVGLRWEGLK